MNALLHIRPDGGGGAEHVVQMLRESGVEVRSVSASNSSGEACDVVVIAPKVDAPLQVARRIRGGAPDVHIVFLTTPDGDAVLRRALPVARLGTEWSIAPAGEPAVAVETVRRAMTAAERRRQLQATLGRINRQLARPAAVAPRRTHVSDHFLALVLDQLSDAVVVLARDGIVVAYNRAAARAFGALRRSASFQQTLPAAAREAVESAFGTAGGVAEVLLTAADGTEYGLRATTLRDEAGEGIGVTMVARDITGIREAEKRRELVAEAVRRLASTLDARAALQRLADLVVADFADMSLVDVAEGELMQRYAVAGRTAHQRELIERTRLVDAATNRRHPSFTAAERGETIMRNDITTEALRTFATSEEHYDILRALDPRALVVAPLRAGDVTIGAILVARSSGPAFSREEADTIEEIARQAATALRNIWSYHALDEASRLKDEFLATLSHELRTPMTSILGWAQILRLEETASATIRDGLESIERSARAQAQLIDDLLDLSRLQMRKLQFQVRPFALGEVVRAAVETIRPAAQDRGIRLLADGGHDVTIAGDPDRIQQVIWNLLSNAVKFSDRDGEVRVALGVEENAARITVSDDGRGIDPAFLPHVFERFRQADSATTRRFGGLGLGLAIVKQLVEMHGGHVEAQSAGEGKGATFVVTLPLSGPPAALEQGGSDAA